MMDAWWRRFYRWKIVFYSAVLVTGVFALIVPLIVPLIFGGFRWWDQVGHILLGPAAGLGIAYSVMEVMRARRQLSNAKETAKLPKELHLLDRNEERVLLAVTRHDGHESLIELPPDYDPMEDGGQLLIATVAPDMDPRLLGQYRLFLHEMGFLG